MTTFAQLDRARSRYRAVVLRALLAIAVLAPTCFLFVQVWGDQRGRLDAIATERHGATYVGAVGDLIRAVVAAGSVAAAGGTVNLQPVDRAAVAVAAVDDRYGDELRTGVLWADAASHLQQLHNRLAAAPADLSSSFDGATTLLLSLAAKVGVTSDLGTDSHPAIASLQDATARQLPSMVAAAGRYASLSALASAGSGRTDASAGSVADQAADQRAEIRDAAAGVTDDINNASETAPSTAVSHDTLNRLDQLGLEVNALTTIGASDTGVAIPDVRRVTQRAAAVEATAGALASSMLTALDNLLTQQIQRVRRDRAVTIAVGVLAVLIALVPLAAVAIRRRPGDDSAPAIVPDVATAVRAPTLPPPTLPPPTTAPPGGQRFAEGGPLPRRRPPERVPLTGDGAQRGVRELMPSGVMHHRRAPGAPDDGAATGTDIAFVSDDWGQNGATR